MVLDVMVLAGIVLAITEIIKRNFVVNGFWVAFVVTIVVGTVAFFVKDGITFLTVIVALLTEVFGYQTLKNVGFIRKT